MGASKSEGLSIKNAETCKLVKELARGTGESLTAAVTVAVRERLATMRRRRRKSDAKLRELLAIGRRGAKLFPWAPHRPRGLALRRKRPAQVILDTSAVIAIAVGEPEFEKIAEVVDSAESCSISAATLVEASIAAVARRGDQGLLLCDAVLKQSSAIVQSPTEEQGCWQGRHLQGSEKAGTPRDLNFGDGFAYALDDFRKTAITQALV